jgi:gliding motility-associated-like protein
MTVTVNPSPTITVTVDSSDRIIAGQQVQLIANGTGITYQWFPSTGLSCSDCSSPVGTPVRTTTYIVTTIDQNGCQGYDTITIYVEDIITLYVPNAFTPYNQGGRNQIFNAYGIGVHEFEFYIFNRWGEIVFETNDLTKGWNGSFKGRQVQDDVYVWLAKATSITGKSISKTGTVTVVN